MPIFTISCQKTDDRKTTSSDSLEIAPTWSCTKTRLCRRLSLCFTLFTMMCSIKQPQWNSNKIFDVLSSSWKEHNNSKQSPLAGAHKVCCYAFGLGRRCLDMPFNGFRWPFWGLPLTKSVSSSLEKSDSETMTLLFWIFPVSKQMKLTKLKRKS